MEKIYPKPIKGKFDLGFVLGFHYFPLMAGEGRTPLGEKLYKFKYCNKESYKKNYGKECREDCKKCKKESLECLVDCASEFVEENKFYGGEFYYADIIIGIPPSDEDKEWQSARILAKAIGDKIGKFVAEYTIKRIKSVPELKDALSKEKRNYEEKARVIKGTIDFPSEKAKNLVRGKKIFLIDDVYDTGATADEITELLKQKGQAEAVYFLAITKTQK